MLLLYRKKSEEKKHTGSIYIPLCFYFILLFLLRSCFRCFIYIPLCFYFIAESAVSLPQEKQIYIPLCFYFIQKPGRAVHQGQRYIYIPLCFYFIYVKKMAGNPPFLFTFHYASTLSSRRIGAVEENYIIYIPLCL